MKKTISVITPAWNEGKNIPVMYEHTSKVLNELSEKYNYELIFMNDGSKDDTEIILREICKRDKNTKAIMMSRNFGHQAAIEAGLNFATGDCVIMLDCDLQQPPELIPELIAKWEEGYELVNTKRRMTKNENFIKKFTGKMFYIVINKISDIYIEPGSADFRLLDRKVVDVLKNMKEKDKFYRGLVNWIGFKSTIVEYDAKDRLHGRTTYTLKRMMGLARVGITSFSMLPMKMILGLGFGIFLLGFVSTLGMLFVDYVLNNPIFSGSAILVTFSILNTGLLIMITGINSVYLMTMFNELKDRPSYIVSDKVNF